MTTNYEKIKNMTLDEMAELFATTKPKTCGMCIGAFDGCLRQVSCKQSIKHWLMSNKPAKKLNSEE